MIVFSIFLIMLILLLCFILILNRADFVAPNTLFLLSLIVCNILLFIYYEKWNLSMSVETFVVYFMGAFLFVIAGEIVHLLIKRININVKNQGIVKSIMINKEIFYFIFILSIIGLLLTVKYLFNVTGGGSLPIALKIYRNGIITGKISISFWPSQIYKITNATVYIYVYILLYNSVNNRKYLQYYKSLYLYILLAGIYFYVFSGGRQGVIELAIYAILVFILLNSTKRKFMYKSVIKLGMVGIAFIPIFYYSSQLVGRNFERISKFSPLEYITRYLGGGMIAFDNIIRTGDRTMYWGQSSFSNIYAKLLSLNIVPSSIENMSYHSFYKYGNTVTIFGRWYEDWGTLGVCCMSILVGGFFSCIYYCMKKGLGQYPYIMVPIYCKLILNIIWAGYDDRICQMLSFSYAIIILITIFSFWILVNKGKVKLILKI